MDTWSSIIHMASDSFFYPSYCIRKRMLNNSICTCMDRVGHSIPGFET